MLVEARFLFDVLLKLFDVCCLLRSCIVQIQKWALIIAATITIDNFIVFLVIFYVRFLSSVVLSWFMKNVFSRNPV